MVYKTMGCDPPEGSDLYSNEGRQILMILKNVAAGGEYFAKFSWLYANIL
jgi:hypothetical protein